MKVILKTGKCRNHGVGDYGGKFPSNAWITVAKLKDWRWMFLVLVHELVEFALCCHRGIKNRDITAWDRKFEALREPGNTDEPGNDPNCLYRAEHRFATRIERLVAKELAVDWKEYDKEITAF